ncbi:MAG: hypothetical protein ACK4N5_10330, partial [Myxococcales bacterium]
MVLGVGMYIEENLQEIVGRFHAAVAEQLQFGEPSLQLAVPILLRGPEWFVFTPWRNNNPRHAGLARVTVPDRAFARRFSLWTTDSEAALAVVTPEFAALMVSLS